MGRRRGGFVRRSGRPLRGMDWGGFDIAQALSGTGSNVAWVLTPGDVRTYYTDPTIMFARMCPIVRVTATVGVGGGAIAFGIIRFTGDPDGAALPAGGSYPTPYFDPEADWLVHQTYLFPEGTTASTFNDKHDRWIHSKARRRLGNDSGLLFVAEWNVLSVAYGVHVRYLLKE